MLLSFLRYFFSDFSHFCTEAGLVVAADAVAPDVRRRVAATQARCVPPRAALIGTIHLDMAVRVREHLLLRRLGRRRLGDLQAHLLAAR